MSTDTPLWEAADTARFWPEGYGRIVLDQTDSTMRDAARRASDLAGPTWIMARRQTAGHGRRGRPWADPAGNFAATLFLRPDEDPGQAALRSFTTALALRLTLAMCVSSDRLTLKWPNDVLLDGGKVAGILLESAGAGARLDWLAIGVGVNLIDAPSPATLDPGAVAPVSVAGQGGAPLSQDDMLFWLAAHFADLERVLTTQGFDPIRRLWLEHAARLGQPVRARTARADHHGTFETVDATGNLVLETPKGRLAIPAADVYF